MLRAIVLLALVTAQQLLLAPLISAQTASSSNATSSSSDDQQLNGWYACSEFTFADDGASPSDAECAVYTAPLCYTGVCVDAKQKTVDIFVKRISAVAGAASAPNVWFLQGGPGAGSTASTSSQVAGWFVDW